MRFLQPRLSIAKSAPFDEHAQHLHTEKVAA
jgi:hypothetical protein